MGNQRAECVKGDNCSPRHGHECAEKLHHQIRPRIPPRSKMSENHRKPEDTEEEVPVVARWMGSQGMPLAGGGGLARVPNLRACYHLYGLRGGTRRGGEG